MVVEIPMLARSQSAVSPSLYLADDDNDEEVFSSLRHADRHLCTDVQTDRERHW